MVEYEYDYRAIAVVVIGAYHPRQKIKGMFEGIKSSRIHIIVR